MATNPVTSTPAQKSSRLLCGLPMLICLASLLAGCGQVGSFGPSGGEPLRAPVTPVQGQPLPGEANANQIGNGPVKIALIIPLTQATGPSVVGTSLRNAAELALAESSSTDLTILVKDDHSVADGASAAASSAINEGAELIVGPLFANNLREVGRIARSAGRPVIGFSTDTSIAARGIYLLSFLIESQVDRVVSYAASKGKKSLAALVPENEYGNVALAAFQESAARLNIRVQTIERYQPGGMLASVKKIAALTGQIDGLFIPEQAAAMSSLSSLLVANGLDGRKVQVMGTALWNDASVIGLPALQGAWFAAPDNAGFTAFAARYRAKFGSDPTRVATLAYDAVSLVAALARAQGSQRFAENVLTNPSGFNGADGVFRFRSDGPNERGLSVFQISRGSTAVVSPAPKSFGSGT